MCFPCRDEVATIGALVTLARRHLVEGRARRRRRDRPRRPRPSTRPASWPPRRRRDGRATSTRIHAEHGVGHGKGNALWASMLAQRRRLHRVVRRRRDDRSRRTGWCASLAPLLVDDATCARQGDVRPADAPRRRRAARPSSSPDHCCRCSRRSSPRSAQPLSGEFAGRRSVLEAVPFVEGWGVEIAPARRHRRAVRNRIITQVDLGVRHHRHRSLAVALGAGRRGDGVRPRAAAHQAGRLTRVARARRRVPRAAESRRAAAGRTRRPPMNVLLLRHAESEWNRIGRWQGTEDPPLSDRGRRDAAQVASVLGPFSAIWTSPLSRARETATIIGSTLDSAPIQIDARLVEVHFADWQGLNVDEIDARWPGFRASGRRPRGAESDDEVSTRAMAALSTIAGPSALHGRPDPRRHARRADPHGVPPPRSSRRRAGEPRRRVVDGVGRRLAGFGHLAARPRARPATRSDASGQSREPEPTPRPPARLGRLRFHSQGAHAHHAGETCRESASYPQHCPPAV